MMVQKRSTTKKPGVKKVKSAPNKCRAIILLDAGPILRQARQDYLVAKGRLEAAQAVLRKLNEVDIPAARAFLSRHQGELLTQARTLHEEMVSLSQLVQEVERFAMLRGISLKAAYKRVMLIRAGTPSPADSVEPDLFDNPAEEHESGGYEEESGSGDFFDSLPDEAQEHLRQRFNDIARATEAATGVKQPDFDEMRAGVAKKQKAESSVSTEVKECYRAIVRLLHPDSNDKFGDREKNLWHQAQEAYKNRDLASLQLILARCEGLDEADEETGLERIQSISTLLDLARRTKRQARMLEYEAIEAEQAHPYWKFTELSAKKQKGHLNKWCREIKQSMADVEYEIQILKSTLERWSRPKAKPSNPPRKRVHSR